MNYKQAGVDINAGDALVKLIKPIAKATHSPGVINGIGGFAAVFDLQAAGFDNPLLVMSTDGVGTKLKIAIDCAMPDTIGIDLVAMCVNDLVVQGATPLAFLDYYATGKLDPATASRVIAGIAAGCLRAGCCALVGGETAEMPDMYANQDYDLAGFAVGAVARNRLLPASIRPGDVLLGLASSGVHSNGYALVRKIVARTRPKRITMADHWQSPAPFCDRSLVDAFMEPTALYVKPVLALNERGLLTGAAHITGGGLISNLPRILPYGCRAVIDRPWAVPPIFTWLRDKGEVSRDDMLRTFNCGIGMVLVMRPDCVGEVRDLLATHQCLSIMLGHVGDGEAHAIGLPDDRWWG